MRVCSVYKYCFAYISIFFLAACASLASADESAALRDPTAPLGHKMLADKVGVAGNTYELNSVLISQQRKLAIINGHTLREGQIIPGSAGVQIKRISAQSVILQQENKRWELTLTSTTIRKY